MTPQTLIDTRTAARRLGLSRSRVAQLVREGKLAPALRAGGGRHQSLFFAAEAVERLRLAREQARAG